MASFCIAWGGKLTARKIVFPLNPIPPDMPGSFIIQLTWVNQSKLHYTTYLRHNINKATCGHNIKKANRMAPEGNEAH